MMDRAKVIKGLECCTIPGNCGTCPWYQSEDAKEGCISTLMKATLKLLKAQEPVNAIVVLNGTDSSGGWWYQCPNCKMEIEPRDKY